MTFSHLMPFSGALHTKIFGGYQNDLAIFHPSSYYFPDAGFSSKGCFIRCNKIQVNFEFAALGMASIVTRNLGSKNLLKN